MIENDINNILVDIRSLVLLIDQDINDLKTGGSKEVLSRNKLKQELINNIINYKKNIDIQLKNEYKLFNNIDKYKDNINNIEIELSYLNQKNNELAYILLPLKDLYDNIIQDFFHQNNSTVNYSV
jgi:cellulose biosynthesis protein BcsQ